MQRLLAFLDQSKPQNPITFEGWQIKPVTGGANNLLYRVTGKQGDYAIKFTIRDARRRAEREFNALSALDGFDLAPRPILLDQERYSLPVVVQTWIEGEVRSEPPQTDEDWSMLVDYLVCLRAVPVKVFLPKPVVYAENRDHCKQIIHEKLDRLPLESQPDSLRDLIRRFDALSMPEWDIPTFTLVRSDPNPRNFIRREGQWVSVDWEYGGLTDPAFEIADMMAHAAYIDVPRERWEWVINRYCSHDGAGEIRIRTYWQMMTVWWAVRFVQYLYEIPRGLDPRLAERSPDWEEQAERKYLHYVKVANEMMDGTAN